MILCVRGMEAGGGGDMTKETLAIPVECRHEEHLKDLKVSN